MADDPRNPSAPRYAGLPVDHPDIVQAIKTAARRGVTKEEAMKRIGMPHEVVERHYREEEREIRKKKGRTS